MPALAEYVVVDHLPPGGEAFYPRRRPRRATHRTSLGPCARRRPQARSFYPSFLSLEVEPSEMSWVRDASIET